MTNQVELLARDMLDEQEWRLAQHLTTVLNDDALDAGSLVLEIIPVYWEDSSKMARTLEPDSIYRPLHYVHMYSEMREVGRFTGVFLDTACGHLEACLERLTPQSPPKSRHPTTPFGTLASSLYRTGVIAQTLADRLYRFNKVVNVSSGHSPTERRFSVSDSAFAFIMMRKLSIQLFAALKTRGVNLPTRWKDLDEAWLTWDRKIPNRGNMGQRR